MFGTANAAPMDADGNIIENTDPYYVLLRDCAIDGFFIHEGVLLMCTIIRDGVTDEEIVAWKKKEKDRVEARWQRFFNGR